MRYLAQMLNHEHIKSGLYLEETRHNIELRRGQMILATFEVAGLTVLKLHTVADMYVLAGVNRGRN